ncbi:MAG TPA: helix-turn-helix transcriptional regulator [Solirubrobacteraceae bacterium]|nr:helix-turn-helix transcriptional regulator [Solirubrobacteraceae bacterium]
MARWNIRTGADMGRAIAEIRTRAGWTQEQMAQRSGLSRTYLSHLESGRSASVLEHMLRVLRRAGATVTVTWPGEDGKE